MILRSGGHASPWEWWGFASTSIKVGNKLYEKKKIRIMSLRRCKERHVLNATMEDEMRQLHVRLDAMETKR
jgi:hypothetical protein